MKRYADKARKASSHNIVIGQQVLITNNARHRNKYTPRWDTNPGVVTDIKGNGIFLTHRGKPIMRSSSQVKPYRTNTHNTATRSNVSTAEDSNSDSEYEIEVLSDTETIAYDDENELLHHVNNTVRRSSRLRQRTDCACR